MCYFCNKFLKIAKRWDFLTPSGDEHHKLVVRFGVIRRVQ